MKNSILHALFIASCFAHCAQAVAITATQSTSTRYKSICNKFEAAKGWGMETSINLQSCDANSIRDAGNIKAYIKKLCTLINADTHGTTQITHIDSPDSKSGYSVAQFIERGLISAHFDNRTNNAYIRLITASPHEATTIAAFSMAFFKARDNATVTALVQ